MAQKTILHVSASAQTDASLTRQVAQNLLNKLDGDVIERDVSRALPAVNEAWVNANFTPVDQRSEEQKAELVLSDQLINELEQTDVLVIGSPLYNFNIAASLKLWIDQIARVGRTFNYTENGPVGLLKDKKAYVVYGSGGVPQGSDFDFASPYLRHVLGFVGITDVTFVPVAARGDNPIEEAGALIEKLVA